MNKKSFEIEIFTEEEPNLSICKDYWEMTDEFTYSHYVKDLSSKFDISIPKVTEIVKSNSKLILKCENCERTKGEYEKRSDFDLTSFKEFDIILCEDCLSDKQKLKVAEIFQEKSDAMEMAVKVEKWKELTQIELETLIEIAESRTKKEVIQKIFKGADLNGDFAQKIWRRINLLDDMNLIWVEREKNGSRILNYHINDKLRQILRSEFPHLFLPSKIEEPHQFRKFQFTMIENFSKKDNHPDYSGFFKVSEEITLRPGNEYSYGGWKNDDGTMFIRIEPAELINSEKFDLDDLTTPF